MRNVLARDIRFEQGLIGTAITGRATFERTSGVMLLVARNVDGNVKALMDWRGAIAFGAAAGLVIGLLAPPLTLRAAPGQFVGRGHVNERGYTREPESATASGAPP